MNFVTAARRADIKRDKIERFFMRAIAKSFARADDENELPIIDIDEIDPAALVPAVFLAGSISWNSETAQYIVSETAAAGTTAVLESGTVVAASEIRVLAETDRLASILNVRQWVREWSAGSMSLSEFETRFLDEIKHSHVRAYIYGRGGRGRMTPADWGRVGATIKEQKRYFRGPRPGGGKTLLELMSNPNPSAKQVARRAQMYINAAREAFEKGQRAAMVFAGFTEVVWLLGVAEHCDDCKDQNDLGWRPVDSLPFVPGEGRTACLTNCKCYLAYRNAAGQVRFVYHGWSVYIENLFMQYLDGYKPAS